MTMARIYLAKGFGNLTQVQRVELKGFVARMGDAQTIGLGNTGLMCIGFVIESIASDGTVSAKYIRGDSVKYANGFRNTIKPGVNPWQGKVAGTVLRLQGRAGFGGYGTTYSGYVTHAKSNEIVTRFTVLITVNETRKQVRKTFAGRVRLDEDYAFAFAMDELKPLSSEMNLTNKDVTWTTTDARGIRIVE